MAGKDLTDVRKDRNYHEVKILNGTVQQHKMIEHVDGILPVVIYKQIELERAVLCPHGPKKGQYRRP